MGRCPRSGSEMAKWCCHRRKHSHTGENTATPEPQQSCFRSAFPSLWDGGRWKLCLVFSSAVWCFFSSVSDGPEAEFSVCFTYLCFFFLKGEESLSSAKRFCNSHKSDHAFREMESWMFYLYQPSYTESFGYFEDLEIPLIFSLHHKFYLAQTRWVHLPRVGWGCGGLWGSVTNGFY